ncbi:50S ribosomal protein L4 [Candidatus Woesearchaeota archaeon]|nr:50S ribosomal protein L4 [Candidatus Woesearchaeota archaeon]
MKADVYNIDGNKSGSVDLPNQFNEPLRKDLIQRAFLAIRSNKKQPYGSYPKAGQRVSAKLSRRRRKFKGAYGKGISRSARKTIWRRGSQFGWVGAFAPGTYKGRRAHPPKAYKDYSEKINKKENKKAIRSALGAVANENLVKERGHLIKNLPLIIDNKIYEIKKTKDLIKFLEKIGLENELQRLKTRKVKAGQGSKRGRKYKNKKGPLFVIGKKNNVSKILSSIRGIDCALINNINVELLAPGGVPGRLTLFTKDAIDVLKEKKLFENIKQEKKIK